HQRLAQIRQSDMADGWRLLDPMLVGDRLDRRAGGSDLVDAPFDGIADMHRVNSEPWFRGPHPPATPQIRFAARIMLRPFVAPFIGWSSGFVAQGLLGHLLACGAAFVKSRAKSPEERPAVQLSKDRILTTHVGSLPRPPDLLAFLEARERGVEFDQAAFEARLAGAVREVVGQQVAAGIDSVCDGEQSKISYTFYVRHRLSGIGAAPGGALDKPPQTGAHRDIADHPDFAARLHASRGGT